MRFKPNPEPRRYRTDDPDDDKLLQIDKEMNLRLRLKELSEAAIACEKATDRRIEYNLPDPAANLQTMVLSEIQSFILAAVANNFNADDRSTRLAPFPCSCQTEAPVEGRGMLIEFG